MFHKTLTSLKNSIIAGIIVIIPIAVTYVVMRSLFNIFRDLFRPVLNRFFPFLHSSALEAIIAFLLAVLVIYIVGLLSAFLAVRRLMGFGEKILARIPLVKLLYLTTKQVIDAVASMQKMSMNKVVIIEYPRKGIRCFAFVTGQVRPEGQDQVFVNIFLPSTPNPTTGFFLMLPKEDVWDVNLTMEEAMKMIISGGILVPPHLELKPYTSLPADKLKRPEGIN